MTVPPTKRLLKTHLLNQRTRSTQASTSLHPLAPNTQQALAHGRPHAQNEVPCREPRRSQAVHFTS